MSQSHRGSNESTGSDCEGPGSDFLDAGKKGAPKRRGMTIRESEVITCWHSQRGNIKSCPITNEGPYVPATLLANYDARALWISMEHLTNRKSQEHIEKLEARIQELTKGNHADAELEEVRKRNEELEAEVRQLSESLAQLGDDDSSANISLSTSPDNSGYQQNVSMFGSPSPSVRRGLSGAPRSINLQGLDTPWTSYIQPNPTGMARSMSGTMSGTNRHSFGAAFSHMEGIEQVLGPASTGVLEEPSRFSYFDPIPPMAFNDARSWPPRSVPLVQSPNVPLPPPPPPPPAPSQNLTTSSLPTRPGMPPQMQSFDGVLPYANPWSLRPWDLPVLNTSVPTCGVDTILMGIVRQQKELAQQGASIGQVIGPSQPSMKALLSPEDPNQTHTISTAISNLLLNLAVRGLVERAGYLYLLYQLCQWQICPSSTTYSNLTDWSSPRTSQLITPHPIWADSILWGKLKDKVIENQQLYANEEFQNAYILCIDANWPYDDLDAFRFEGNDVFITEAFEKHVRTLSNWSLDERFAARYPELADLVRITGRSP
ncbi:bZIP transcription factor protein [Rutstroemia sp. NJR-2017a WRK4]|nr:bZIP transcription factor protein [Rutstroemia sp. NJR-2017a WRK4]